MYASIDSRGVVRLMSTVPEDAVASFEFDHNDLPKPPDDRDYHLDVDFGNKTFSLRPVEPEPDPEPTTEERVAALEDENAMLKAQITAQSDQMDFYEDCIAEMASIVYA